MNPLGLEYWILDNDLIYSILIYDVIERISSQNIVVYRSFFLFDLSINVIIQLILLLTLFCEDYVLGGGWERGLKPVYGVPTSPSASAVVRNI